MLNLAQWKESGNYCTIRGHQIFYRIEGTGQPLLLLHGFPTNSWDWHKIYPVLKLKFQVVTLDLLGFGFSDKPTDHEYSLFEQADIVEELLEELNIKNAALMAHEYGGAVLQELLTRQQSGSLHFRINRAIMLNGGLFHSVYKPKLIQKLLNTPLGFLIVKLFNKKAFERVMRSIFSRTAQPSKVELTSMWEAANLQNGALNCHRIARYLSERKRQAARWEEAIVHANIPLLFINGVLDSISGEAMCDYYEHHVPDPNVVRLQTGHYPHQEAPKEVLQSALTFLLEP